MRLTKFAIALIYQIGIRDTSTLRVNMPCRYGSQFRFNSQERLVQRQTSENFKFGSAHAVPRPCGYANQTQLDSIMTMSPYGLHPLMQKMVRSIILGRPLRIVRFIADFLDAELTKRTFGELGCGCHLLKCKFFLLQNHPKWSSILTFIGWILAWLQCQFVR